jgi:hypothetical protein
MKEYREFQFGWIIFGCIIFVQVLMTHFYLNNVGDSPLDANIYLVVSLLNTVVLLLFYGLTTRATNEMIVISFGIGIIKKRIRLDRIKSVEAVKTPWYYGWGIRIIPKGILYNVSGLHGVELKFNDTNRVLRIGTRDSHNLKLEIAKRLSRTE